MAGASTDFFELWRTLFQNWESQANAVLSRASQQEGFGREMNRALGVSLQMQAAFNEAVEKAMAGMNLPTRTELTRLSEQLTGIDAKLDRLMAAQQLDPAAGADEPRKPARTRRPNGEGARS